MAKIAILDIETTGFLQAGGTIVEIGIVELDLETGERKIVFDKVTHEKGITREHVEKAWIIKNSDMTVEEIQNSQSLETIRQEVQEVINSYPDGVTAYNNAFDFGFLEDRGFHFPNKLACPMKLSTPICKIPKKRGHGFKWPNVEEAYKFFTGKTEFIEAHRGADDAMHEAVIVHELYKMGVFTLS